MIARIMIAVNGDSGVKSDSSSSTSRCRYRSDREASNKLSSAFRSSRARGVPSIIDSSGLPLPIVSRWISISWDPLPTLCRFSTAQLSRYRWFVECREARRGKVFYFPQLRQGGVLSGGQKEERTARRAGLNFRVLREGCTHRMQEVSLA